MKNIDYPPKLSDDAGEENLKDIPVESFEDTREVKYSPEDPLVLQKKEELFHDQERIKELGTQLRAQRIAEINSIPLRQPLGNEPWSPSKITPTSNSLGRKFRNFTLAALASLGMISAAKANEKNPGDSLDKKSKIENITRSENTAEVSAKLRQDWNEYVDWLETLGMKGNPALDKNDLGGAMIDRYKKEHPETSVSRETVDDIQSEFAKYREWVIAEIKAGKGEFAPGTTEDNFLKRLSVVDNIAGQYTTQHKFPDAYMKTFYNGKLVEVNNLGFAKRGGNAGLGNEVAKNQ